MHFIPRRPIFAEFRGQDQSAKIKIREIFSYFWKISVKELVAYMVAVCGSYLFACGKTSNMQLSQNKLPLQDFSDLLSVTLLNFLLLLYLTLM